MKWIFLLLQCFMICLIADPIHRIIEKGPWFTGPLIAPSGDTVPAGHWNIQPYLYYFVFPAKYNSHWKVKSIPNFYSTVLQVQAKVGLLKWLDFQFQPQIVYNRTQGADYCNIDDLPIGINIQILKAKIKSWKPSTKLSFRVNIPLGKYQHLKPSRKGTDAIGVGSWFPGVLLTFSKLFHLSKLHYLETRLSFNYQIGTPVHVKGLNSYGGAPNTHGVVYPGNFFSVDGAIEYSITQNWAFACDLIYAHDNKTRFSGKVGSIHGQPASNTLPSDENWSLAPAIEYNWSKRVGLIAGSWFSFAGRNSLQFYSAIISVNIYI